jgi:tetratricopeptide (TPR) repeat protein
VAITLLRQSPEHKTPVTAMSEDRKTRIDQFWTAYRRASDFRLAGDLENAVDAYRQALALNDRHEDALYYLGNTLFQLDRYDEALASFRRLIEVNPLSARAHFQTGAILTLAEPDAPFNLDAAKEEFQRAFEINREESEPLVRLGEVELARGAYDRAETLLTDAARLNTRTVTALYLLGYLRWRAGDRNGATDFLATARARSREDRPVHGVAGEGDTRDRRRQEEGRQSLFMPHVTSATDDLEQSSDDVYTRFDRFREQVYRRWCRP